MQHEHCKPIRTGGEGRLGGLPARKVTLVVELHGAEDGRRGGEEDRTFQHYMLNPSRAARPGGNRHFQCRGVRWGQAFPVPLRGGGAGVPGGVGTGVLAQPVPVRGSAMGTSVSSVGACTGQALQGTVGTGGPGGAQGQDWSSQCCVVRGDDAALVGMVLLAGMDVTWVLEGGGCVGPRGALASGLAWCGAGWHAAGWAGVGWGGQPFCGVGGCDVGMGWLDVGWVDLMLGGLA